MNKKISSIIQYAVLVFIGGLLIYFSIKRTSVSKEEIIQAFSQANWFWITISLIISFFSHFARAYRWNYLLENYGHRVDVFTSTASVLIGYLANYGLPRMGEISRCAVVSKYNKIPVDIALGTVIAERVIDLILMFVVFLLVVNFQYHDLQALLNMYVLSPLNQKFQNVNWSIVLVAGLLFVAVLFWIMRKKSSSSSLMDKVIQFVQNLFRPLLGIHKLKRPVGFGIWSLTIWLLYFLSMYTCALSLNATEHLGVYKILVLFLFGTVGVIVTPGGIGAYHFLVTEILLFYGVDKASAVVFPWIIWGTQFILILISGGFSFILLPLYHSKKINS